MIEATCAACGTVNRIAEAEVPPGAKFVSCTSCKSKVPVPMKAVPAIPKLPTKIPAIPPRVPTPAKGMPAPVKKSEALDLADLPAPKRQSPLAGADAPSKPAPKSALAGAELPVPKSAPKPPAPQPSSLDLDDLMPPDAPASAGLADLPAPKTAPRSALADLPAPKTAPRSALADLPAPKTAPASALADLPAPKAKGITDLPAPTSGLTDLPAPTSGLADLPAPKAKGITDLPAPKAKVITDLPAPKAKGITDLPAPKGPVGLTDLPMPKGPPAGGTLELDDLDLPMPAAGISDLPTPKPGANGDLPAPKGFFDDLPQPARNATTQDVAPKGFFDDLPQPAKNAPTQDVAPKGFFDDLPQPAKNAATQDVAPKGFFDDLPQPQKNAPTQDVAPSGLFDDLPQPNRSGSAGGLFDDIAPGGKSPADMALGAGDIDLGPSSGPGLELDGGPELDLGASGLGASGPGLDLGGSARGGLGAGGPGLDLGGSDGPELDLGLPLGEGPAFQDLDLSEPTPRPADPPSPIKIKTPAKGAEKKPIPINVPQKGGDLKLDLADDPHDASRIGAPAAAQKVAPKKKATPTESPETRGAKKKRTRLVLASLLGVAALGAGGFYFYQRHAAAQAKADEIASQLQVAEKAIQAGDGNHWSRAKKAADQAIELDSTNPRAVGLAAEATIAGAIDNGVNYDARIKQGRALIQQALGAGRTGPELERAQAVAAIAAKGQAQRAVDLLKAQIARAPKDGWLQLYMGWAQLAKGDSAAAIKAFDQAIALAPATKLPALYGQGEAKLLVADVEGARAAFATILQANKDHVCAQIGLIATNPPSESVRNVEELEAVLQRKGINSADPRCVVHALTLIGDVHRAAGRLDMARQRYRDALKLVPNDIDTHDGLAAVELRDGKLEVAADHIQKALAVNADHPATLLLQAELDVRQGKLPDAESLVEKLAAHKPPLPTLEQARLAVVRGKLLEAKGEPDAAVDAYVEGAKLAGDLDLTPTMEATKTLSELAKKATDPAKAAAYRERADQLLSGLAARAQEDAQLSMMLGVAYLQTGDAAKAETFLRRAADMNESDPEARLQLAKALSAQGKADDAIQRLEQAQKLDGSRTDIALELAKTYAQANRPDKAMASYDKLLALPDVSNVVRVNAGRYFATHGMIEKAAAQADPILATEPENPGGLYLKAEGLIAAQKPEEAAALLTRATDTDPDARYLDALGRALEARLVKSGDTKYIEGARFAYERAAKADPSLFHAWLGQGKMLVANRDWDAAVKPLLEANKLDKHDGDTMYYLGTAYFGLRNANSAYGKTAAQWLAAALKTGKELPLAEQAQATYMLGELYDEMNKAGDAARAYERATQVGEQLEKQGAAPAWLTETYYELGDLYYKLGNPALQARAWERYVDRKPKDSVRLTTAKQALATSLKRYR